jgi:hypothetical protein
MAHPNADMFRKTLADRLSAAQAAGHSAVKIRAGDLHKDVVKGKVNQMPNCCRIMKAAMADGDEILPGGPQSGQGGNLEIRYKLPRPQN